VREWGTATDCSHRYMWDELLHIGWCSGQAISWFAYELKGILAECEKREREVKSC
jgi:Trm5-related predicted tRNA methylase